MKISSALTILASFLPLSTLATDVYQVHGSGTTNPSKCIWKIMSLFEGRAKGPIRMTYRAVGSGTGIKEFLGVNNTSLENSSDPFQHLPHVDFGSGDIPIPTGSWEKLQATGDPTVPKVAQLPFALSSVSFFYNLEGVDGDTKIDLDACLLAQIFNKEITHWDDPELTKSNPVLSEVGAGLEITVCRRTLGSSSTSSITAFLNKKCPGTWGSNQVGSALDNWNSETIAVQGSGGMTVCISENNGAIGYLDSGHGWSEGLREVSVKNAAGNYVTAREALTSGGIQNAAAEAWTPASALDDWGTVDFIDQAGDATYPIVLMSYIYVRTQIWMYMTDEYNRGLLKLFLQSLYMDTYFTANCAQLGFFAVPTSIREKATRGIDDIEWEFTSNQGNNPWSFEIDTRPLEGPGDYVISSKRQNYQGVVLDDVTSTENTLLEDTRALFALAEKELKFNKFSDTDKQQLNTSLVLAALSFTLWCCVIVGYMVKWLFVKM